MFAELLLTIWLPLAAGRYVPTMLPDADVIMPLETNEQKFHRSDVNNDGKLTYEEFSISDSDLEQIKLRTFNGYDQNGDGEITRDEFDRTVVNLERNFADRIGSIFEDFDEDFDLKIDEDEARKIFAELFSLKPRDNFAELFANFDKDGDRKLNIKEYIQFDENFTMEEMDPIEELRTTKFGLGQKNTRKQKDFGKPKTQPKNSFIK